MERKRTVKKEEHATKKVVKLPVVKKPKKKRRKLKATYAIQFDFYIRLILDFRRISLLPLFNINKSEKEVNIGILIFYVLFGYNEKK